MYIKAFQIICCKKCAFQNKVELNCIASIRFVLCYLKSHKNKWRIVDLLS